MGLMLCVKLTSVFIVAHHVLIIHAHTKGQLNFLRLYHNYILIVFFLFNNLFLPNTIKSLGEILL